MSLQPPKATRILPIREKKAQDVRSYKMCV